MAQLSGSGASQDGELRFDGQVAIVTGAGSPVGLGRAYAHLLASRGAKLLVNDLGVGPDGRGNASSGAELVAQEIMDLGGAAEANFGSVADRSDCAAMVAQARETWGRVDILINNAGIAPFARFMEISDADIERVVSVHLMGHIWMCRAVWPVMVNQGYGRIVNVSSAVGLRGMLFQSIYSAAKLGILGLTRALASEGVGQGIGVNAILPAADTAAWQELVEPGFSATARETGLVVDAVAPVAAYLAHGDCTVSGKMLDARGGGVQEVLFARTRGLPAGADLTVEKVRDGLGQIRDRTATDTFADPDGALPPGFVPKPYEQIP